MNYVVDASVVLKLVLEELGSDQARRLVESEDLAAPDFMWLECANVLWVKARRGQISAADAQLALEALLTAPIARFSVHDIVFAAQGIALALNHPVYDCLYLAAAMRENATLVSADARFVQASQSHEVYAGRVALL